MPDDASILLKSSGQEPRDVLESDDRNVEGIAEANEPRAFDRRVDVQTTCPRGKGFLLLLYTPGLGLDGLGPAL